MAYVLKILVNYKSQQSRSVKKLPALLTESGFLISHLRYLAENDMRSSAWKERSTFALRLLVKYMLAYGPPRNARKMFRDFSEAVLVGTIDYRSMDDPKGLFWSPRAISDANNILNHINSYTDFIARQDGYDVSKINPFRRASSYEERLNWCAYLNKKKNLFLNHLSPYRRPYEKPQFVREVTLRKDLLVQQNDVPRFPEKYLSELYKRGFKLKSGELDYKSIAITMLLNAGGLRKSEVFQLYTSDITLHPNRPGEPLVRVYHPEFGGSPDSNYRNRAEDLLATSSYKPRNRYLTSEKLRSGWKGALLTDRRGFFEVIFNPPHMAQEFLKVWALYLKYQRVDPSPKNFHPFAFTNSKGNPETISRFQLIHKQAVERIGLTADKSQGTTEHGHRHAYGYRCRKAGLSQVEVQKAMHHRSPNSCLVYIQPTVDELRAELTKVELGNESD